MFSYNVARELKQTSIVIIIFEACPRNPASAHRILWELQYFKYMSSPLNTSPDET